MGLTDTHCHIYKEYYADIESLIKSSESLGVDRYINSAFNYESCTEVLDLVNKYSNMYGILGIHPEDVDNYKDRDLEFINDNLSNDKIVAVGEIGLDYYYTKENIDRQKELFIKQLDIAKSVNKPVVIHSREATMDVMNILKTYDLVGVIHSFSGSLETALEYVKMGYVLGISGVVTFKNCNLKDILVNVPIDNIIIETDAPYLTPVPHRGKQNIPGYAMDTARFVADVYGISVDKLVEITNKNIARIFDI